MTRQKLFILARWCKSWKAMGRELGMDAWEAEAVCRVHNIFCLPQDQGNMKYSQALIRHVIAERQRGKPFRLIAHSVKKNWPDHAGFSIGQAQWICSQHMPREDDPNTNEPVIVSLAGPTWSRPGHPDYERRKETA